MIPVIKNFRATNLAKAFLLNAFVSACVVILAIEIRHIFEDEDNAVYGYFNKLYGTKQMSEIQILTIVFPATLISALLVYIVMYILFGYGGNFLISTKRKMSIFS